MLSGRSPKNQTVHFPLPDGESVSAWTGKTVDVHVTEAKTWYLAGEVVR